MRPTNIMEAQNSRNKMHFLLAFILLLFTIAVPCITKSDDIANAGHIPQASGDYVAQKCWNFTLGDWRRHEFYSPSFPDVYPNNTECIQLLKAPKGYRIRLDFRDEFHIEKTDDCKYDFLELRDGPFGYSPLLGQYCGRQFPPLTLSSSRYLWIRFKSDETIEYKGFRAVYEFYKPDQDEINTTRNYTMCRIDVDTSKPESLISSRDVPQHFRQKANMTGEVLDCTWVAYANKGERMYVVFKDYKMTAPQSCESTYVEVYDRTTATSDRQKKYCGNEAKQFKSSSNHFYLHLHSEDPFAIPHFKAVFTIYTEGPCDSNLYYDCGDNTCIDKSLECNGNYNCNFEFDEKGCKVTSTMESGEEERTTMSIGNSTIILGVVGGLIVTLVSLGIFITCYQRRKEEQRRKHVLKQEERNAMEMTTLLNKNPSGSPQRRATSSSSRATNQPGGSLPPASTANHVPPKLKNATQVPNHNNNGGLRAPVHGNGRKPSNTSGDFDVSDLYDTPNEGPTFRRYLDINNFNDDDSSPNPSTCNQIPAIVTIETPRSPKKSSVPNTHTAPARRVLDNKDPYSKPDIVTSGMYAKINKHPSPPKDIPRRLSLDTVQSEQSDVWKPMGVASTLPNDKGEPSRLYQWSDTSTSPVMAIEKEAMAYHQGEPPRRETPRKIQRSDSGSSRKGKLEPTSPEIFYSRPNKAGIRQQHHPV